MLPSHWMLEWCLRHWLQHMTKSIVYVLFATCQGMTLMTVCWTICCLAWNSTRKIWKHLLNKERLTILNRSSEPKIYYTWCYRGQLLILKKKSVHARRTAHSWADGGISRVYTNNAQRNRHNHRSFRNLRACRPLGNFRIPAEYRVAEGFIQRVSTARQKIRSFWRRKRVGNLEKREKSLNSRGYSDATRIRVVALRKLRRRLVERPTASNLAEKVSAPSTAYGVSENGSWKSIFWGQSASELQPLPC